MPPTETNIPQRDRFSIDDHQAVVELDERDFRILVVHHLRLGRDTMGALGDQIAENTELTRNGIASTAELVEIFKGAKTGASAFKWLGISLRKFVKFIYPFLLVGGAIMAIKNGHWPRGE